jgi:hypothetical protein
MLEGSSLGGQAVCFLPDRLLPKNNRVPEGPEETNDQNREISQKRSCTVSADLQA